VLKAYDDIFGSRALKKYLLLLEEGFSAHIVPHVIGEWDVVRGWDQVCPEEEALPLIGYLDPLLAPCVSVDAMKDESRHNLG
jgi:hypothetical protein